MRQLVCTIVLLLTACQTTPRGLALCSRAPRLAELTVSDLAVHRVCVDFSAVANFTGSALVTQVLTDSGLHVAADPQCEWRLVLTFDSPAGLSEPAAAVWSAGAASQERFAVLSVRGASQAISTIYAGNDRAAVYGVRAAVASLVNSAGGVENRLFQSGTIVDYPSFALRGVVESIYGKSYSVAERQATLMFMNCLEQNLYIYGQKDSDPYAHFQWADPYPESEAVALRSAAQTARENLVSFVWAVSPGWWGGAEFIKDSICYSCDADFERLKSKTAAMRALGITRFSLLLDDLAVSLPWPADQAKFSSLAAAHAFLINRWDDYLMATGASEHLLVVGDKYSSDETNALSGQGWRFYNLELAAAVHPGVQLFWTGPKVYSPSISAADLTDIDQILGQKVIVWDNWPKTVSALSDRAEDLPAAASGFVSCPVLNQRNAHPVADFWPVLGTAADYSWRPETYVPAESFARWERLLRTLVP